MAIDSFFWDTLSYIYLIISDEDICGLLSQSQKSTLNIDELSVKLQLIIYKKSSSRNQVQHIHHNFKHFQ